MARFLIRPKAPDSVDALSFEARRIGNDSREDRLKRVKAIRAETAAQRELDRYLRDDLKRDPAAKVVSRLDRAGSVTGTTVVDMPEATAEEVRKTLSDVFVIPDGEINLIQPHRREDRTSDKLLDDQLWHLSAIGLKEARCRGYSGNGSGVTIGVLDTGIDGTVAALHGKIAGAFRTNVAGWSMDEMDESEDTVGHGTHVAGLICGDSVGVAPGAKVVNCTIIPHGRGNLSDFVLAIEWAAMRPEIQIVNISAGLPGYLPQMEDAVHGLLATGVLPVVAVGNEGRHRTRSPGNYRDVLSVGAMNKRYTVSRFGGSGNILATGQLYSKPDLVAPGESVYSCVPGGQSEAWDGTSMAAPIVSGIAALALERHPDRNVLDLMEALLEGCRNLQYLKDRQGMGLVQVI